MTPGPTIVGEQKCARCGRSDLALDPRTGYCLECQGEPHGVFPKWDANGSTGE